ncbi:FecCD family ABC transporter permease [Naasia lichenicola]|uniref:Iron-enterobactin ABC transporter permease n=1 Tax=Naasia lichenicola TaxID=2565933 RepID=A0A4S4FGW2_9MICO|nr:iron chelate uptake ABC transporter family permease subunit [Naasia lichenicola]THG29248.1 iron-enterobactin ABC transporter permease [Naasia lichenicola]
MTGGATLGSRPASAAPTTAGPGATRPVRPPRLRSRTVVLALAIGCVLLALVALGLGDFPLDPVQVVQAAFTTDGGFATTIVLEWRLPRVLAALVFGAALAVSGGLFQTLTANPLGSPDIIGFSTGAYTGALLVLTLAGTSFAPVAVGAVAGGLVSALLAYVLAYRRGVHGFRLIIVGIGVTAILQSANTLLLRRASTEVAMEASFWGAGSLSLVGWSQFVPVAIALAVLTPAVFLVSRPLRQLELGDDAARAHGVRVERSRLTILVLGVALIALVTAISGPIAFVALAAPQIAHRIARSPGIPLVGSALVGALLLLSADMVAQHLPPTPIPVGVVTIIGGGVYLLALLVHEARGQR